MIPYKFKGAASALYLADGTWGDNRAQKWQLQCAKVQSEHWKRHTPGLSYKVTL